MNSRKLWLPLAALLLVTALWFVRREYTTRARSELVQLATTTALNDLESRVLERCAQAKYIECRRFDASQIEVQTPLEFGARNWIVLFDVDHGKVSGVRFRTPDSVKSQPPGSPPDRVLSDAGSR